MQIGQLLGSGRSADVFELDDDWVLRRYRHGGDAAAEAAVMAHLSARGFPVPAVRSTGTPSELVMQRLSGATMLQAWRDGAITEEDAAAVLAELLHHLHSVPARVSALPEDRILHLDLHPDNVMLTPQGPVVIDWCTTEEGPPGLDWAMSALILAQVAVGPSTEVAAGARSMLTALMGHAGTFVDLGDGQAGPLAQARARRAADPNLSSQELALLDDAVALVSSRRIVAMTVFSCSACQQRITSGLREVPLPSPVTEDVPGHRFLPSLMPRGSYAVSPHTGVFVLDPDDISGVARHPDRGRLNGCCGLDGLDGPHLVCDACGAEVATQQSDCWSQQLVALIPDAVTMAVSSSA
ncbi:phosphotransferase [Streptomyces sp. NPDC059002]|uniref:phosphotransferase n=1 Tax=Streptomyces sp. NPDC059002 TaxID=3346690 RepID=UPI0036A727D3